MEASHRSVSSMCNFARCPRLYCWRKMIALERPSTTRNLAMKFGSAIHAGVPFTHTGDLAAAMDAFAKEWGDNDGFEDKKRNTRVGKNILLSLHALHCSESFPLRVIEPAVRSGVTHKGDCGPHERWFEVDMGLPSGKLVVGRLDALAEHKDDGTEWVIEYKTAAQIWKTFPENFVISPQLETYVTALNLLGYSIVGGMVEGILVAAGKTDTLTVPVIISPETMEDCIEWWKWKDTQLSALEAASPEDPLSWPMERSACTAYAQYGQQGWVCDFQPLCEARSNWKQLMGLFDQVEKRA